MPDLLIARDPIPGGRLPYLLSLPVAGEAPLILACAEVWPGAKDVFCHPLAAWPPDAQLLETLPVEQCWRVGKDERRLVLGDGDEGPAARTGVAP